MINIKWTVILYRHWRSRALISYVYPLWLSIILQAVQARLPFLPISLYHNEGSWPSCLVLSSTIRDLLILLHPLSIISHAIIQAAYAHSNAPSQTGWLSYPLNRLQNYQINSKMLNAWLLNRHNPNEKRQWRGKMGQSDTSTTTPRTHVM